MSAFTEEMGRALMQELQRSFLIQRSLLDVLRDLRDVNAELRDELRAFRNVLQKEELERDLGRKSNGSAHASEVSRDDEKRDEKTRPQHDLSDFDELGVGGENEHEKASDGDDDWDDGDQH